MEGILYCLAIFAAVSAAFGDSPAEPRVINRPMTFEAVYSPDHFLEFCKRENEGYNERELAICAQKIFKDLTRVDPRKPRSNKNTREDTRKSSEANSNRQLSDGAEETKESPLRTQNNQPDDESTKPRARPQRIDRLTEQEGDVVDTVKSESPRLRPLDNDQSKLNDLDLVNLLRSQSSRSRPKVDDRNAKSVENKIIPDERDGPKEIGSVPRQVDRNAKSVEDKTDTENQDGRQKLNTEKNINFDSGFGQAIETALKKHGGDAEQTDNSNRSNKSEIRDAIRKILERKRGPKSGSKDSNVNTNANTNEISEADEAPKLTLFAEGPVERSKPSRINTFKRRERKGHRNKDVNKNINTNTNTNDITIKESRRRTDRGDKKQPDRGEESGADSETAQRPVVNSLKVNPVTGRPINTPTKKLIILGGGSIKPNGHDLVSTGSFLPNDESMESSQSVITDEYVIGDGSSYKDNLLTQTILKLLIINRGQVSSAKVKRLEDLLKQLNVHQKEKLLKVLKRQANEPITIEIEKEVLITESKPQVLVGKWVVGKSARNSKFIGDLDDESNTEPRNEREGNEKATARSGPVVVNTSVFSPPPSKTTKDKQQPNKKQEGRPNSGSGSRSNDNEASAQVVNIVEDEGVSDQGSMPLGSRTWGKRHKKIKVPKRPVIQEDYDENSNVNSNVNNNINTNVNSNLNKHKRIGSRRTLTETDPLIAFRTGRTSKRRRVNKLDIAKKEKTLNNNVNTNTNTNVIKDRSERDNEIEDDSMERRGLLPRPRRIRPRPSRVMKSSKNQNINKNVNINTNSNVNTDEIKGFRRNAADDGVDTEYRINLDRWSSNNANSNTNSNVNTNDNSNVDRVVPRKVYKRKFRKDEAKLDKKSVDSILRDIGVLRKQLEEQGANNPNSL